MDLPGGEYPMSIPHAKRVLDRFFLHGRVDVIVRDSKSQPLALTWIGCAMASILDGPRNAVISPATLPVVFPSGHRHW